MLHFSLLKMVFLKFEMFLVIFILVLTLLYKKNGTFLYYFKYILYVGLSNIIVILVLPIFMFRPKNIHNLLLVIALILNIHIICCDIYVTQKIVISKKISLNREISSWKFTYRFLLGKVEILIFFFFFIFELCYYVAVNKRYKTKQW